MISGEELLLQRIGDLFTCVPVSSDYDALRVGAILRQLLLDSPSLVHSVNRTYKVRIVFAVNANAMPTSRIGVPLLDLPAHGLLPMNGSNVARLPLDRFLGTAVMKVEGTAVSVRDLIRLTANKLGGVHRDEETSAEENKVLGLLSFVGGSLCLTMDAIARIVVVALHPLRVAAWRPPANLPLLAHYRPPIWGALTTPGNGQYLHTVLSELRFEPGLSWYGMLQVTHSKSETSRSIYELGVKGEASPRFAIKLHGDTLSFGYTSCDGDSLSATGRRQFTEAIYAKPLLLGVELELSPNAAIRHYESPFPVRGEPALANSADGGSISLQTLGANLEGQEWIQLAVFELVVVLRPMTVGERREMFNYFRVAHSHLRAGRKIDDVWPNRAEP